MRIFHRRRDPISSAEPARSPESTSAWLHVVGAESPEPAARGAMELAARFLALGERVLIVDGGPRLALNERFGRESRWGVVECLTGSMPVLGLVQDTGRLGLYLLAHGTPARRTHWPQLGRLLEEARPHFGRAVLALPPDAPPVIGEALEGWHLEGWWVAEAGAARRRNKLGHRLHVHLNDLDVAALPHATLDSLEARIWTLAAGAPVTAGASGRPEESAGTAMTPDAGLADDDAPVVGCDPQVRNRLRFLLWMRRLQSERTPQSEIRETGAVSMAAERTP
jgi:hypothetical protein